MKRKAMAIPIVLIFATIMGIVSLFLLLISFLLFKRVPSRSSAIALYFISGILTR